MNFLIGEMSCNRAGRSNTHTHTHTRARARAPMTPAVPNYHAYGACPALKSLAFSATTPFPEKGLVVNCRGGCSRAVVLVLRGVEQVSCSWKANAGMPITGQTLALINAKQQQQSGVIAHPERNRTKREGYCSCPRAPCDRMLCSVARSGGRR